MGKTIAIGTQCVSCNSSYHVTIPYEGYLKWQAGKLIQNALPDVSITDREFLISHLCPTCQEILFRPEPSNIEA